MIFFPNFNSFFIIKEENLKTDQIFLLNFFKLNPPKIVFKNNVKTN
jgi:hypothetical protein